MNSFNNNSAKISIVTPSFNQGQYLDECIDSILSQNYPNLEYVIMDGGSSDNSVDIIKKYEKYLAYWQSRPDDGQYAAINDGFKKTSGEVMAWLNSDDKYHRDSLFKVSYLFSRHTDVEWVIGRPTCWGKDGEITNIASLLPTYSRQAILEGRYNQPFIQQESTFWKRSLWNRAGGCLRTDLEFAGDLELWLRFFRHAVLYSVDTLIGGYRIHGNQKAQLFMDRYCSEADLIISDELDFQGGANLADSTDSPAPLALDRHTYNQFLQCVLGNRSEVSPLLMSASEDALSCLLAMVNGLQTDSRLNSVQSSALLYEAEALRSSLSWRITKPLRWMGDKVRGIAGSKW